MLSRAFRLAARKRLSGLKMERVKGVEPSSQPWQGCIMAVIRHPRLARVSHAKRDTRTSVPWARIELATPSFSEKCSTTELPRQAKLAIVPAKLGRQEPISDFNFKKAYLQLVDGTGFEPVAPAM
jgi:hypothetical protein